MAYCTICNAFFKPTADEEKLIAAHKMDEICLQCEIARSRASEDAEHSAHPEATRLYNTKCDGSKLRRAEQYDAEGNLVKFVALPRPPLPLIKRSLVKPRPYEVHVTLLGGSGHGNRAMNEPRVLLHTNLEAFRKTKLDFWVRKMPPFQCPQTGTSSIEIPHDDVKDVEVNDTTTTVHLHDGGFVRMQYV